MAGLRSRQVSSPSQDTDDPSHSQQKPFRTSNQANVRVLNGGIPPWGTQRRTFLQNGPIIASCELIYADVF